MRRGTPLHDANADRILAAIAQTGHYADVTLGMALIPVSRHSALASFFKLSVSTTLAFHMLTAYTLFTLVIIHTLLYVSWLPSVSDIYSKSARVFPVLNPTYLYHEVWPGDTSSLGIWRASLIFTGAAAALIMVVLSVTTLPWVRLRHFNFFYFTHLFSILAVVIVCLHASTLFYCTSPGLAMIILDWGMRFYELRVSLSAKVEDLTRGWFLYVPYFPLNYFPSTPFPPIHNSEDTEDTKLTRNPSVSLELPRHRLDGCACRSPLAHFYLHHGVSSLRELHPFTTITHLASQANATNPKSPTLPISFLFRAKVGSARNDEAAGGKSGGCPISPAQITKGFKWLFKRRARLQHVQWTEKLASLAVAPASPDDTTKYAAHTPPDDDAASTESAPNDEAGTLDPNTSLRLEGPYFTPSDPAAYTSVLCLVAGTGVSGALAIAAAFAAQSQGDDESVTQTPEEKVVSEKDEANTAIATTNAIGTLAAEVEKERVASDATSRSPSASSSPPPHPKASVGGRRWRTTKIIWSVRRNDYIDLPLPRADGLEMAPYLTGPADLADNNGEGVDGTAPPAKKPPRLDMRAAVREARDAARALARDQEGDGAGGNGNGRLWVYISGPNGFIAVAEEACKKEGVSYYGARWDI